MNTKLAVAQAKLSLMDARNRVTVASLKLRIAILEHEKECQTESGERSSTYWYRRYMDSSVKLKAYEDKSEVTRGTS